MAKTIVDQRKQSDSDRLLNALEDLPSYVRFFYMSNRQLSLKTRIEYAKDFKIFLNWLTKANPLCFNKSYKDIPIDILENLDIDDINEYIFYLQSEDKGNNAEVTINRKIASLKMVFLALQERKYIVKNPTILIKGFKLEKNDAITVFTAQRKRELLDFIEADTHPGWTPKMEKMHEKTRLRDYAIFMTFFGTGMRISELTGMNIDDINFNDGSIFIHRKGNKAQEVFFGDEVSAALISYIELERNKFLKINDEDNEEKAVFLSRRGQRMTERSIEKRMDAYCDALYGKSNPYHPHVCRATYATDLYNTFGDIKLVADSLGHASVDTAQRHYAKSAKEHRKMAATMPVINES